MNAELTDLEKRRIAECLSLFPEGVESVLEIGSRDGRVTFELARRVARVTALDLHRPQLSLPNVECAKGDVRTLEFRDRSFDCVVCTEVLEHIEPGLDQACWEISRVAKQFILLGVPFDQDTRLGATTCSNCGLTSPPWGHVNSFSAMRTVGLFPGFHVAKTHFVGRTRCRTTALAAYLAGAGGNQWGTYAPGERCIHCGAELSAPTRVNSRWRRMSAAAAVRLDCVTAPFTKQRPLWMHTLFERSEN